MRRPRTMQAVAIAGLLFIGTITAGAAANRLSLSNRNFRWTWLGFTFTLATGNTMECALTMEGSFHSATIAKTRGALIGYITRATATSCNRGHATVLQATLPWHVRYASFQGTLPEITDVDVNVVGLGMQIEQEREMGAVCLAASESTNPALFEMVRTGLGLLTTVHPNSGVQIALISPFGCPAATVKFSGTGETVVLGTTTRITVRLI